MISDSLWSNACAWIKRFPICRSNDFHCARCNTSQDIKVNHLISLHDDKSGSFCILLCHLFCLHSFCKLQVTKQSRLTRIPASFSNYCLHIQHCDKFHATDLPQLSDKAQSQQAATNAINMDVRESELLPREQRIMTWCQTTKTCCFLKRKKKKAAAALLKAVHTSVPKDKCVMATSSTRMLNSFALFVKLSRICMNNISSIPTNQCLSPTIETQERIT